MPKLSASRFSGLVRFFVTVCNGTYCSSRISSFGPTSSIPASLLLLLLLLSSPSIVLGIEPFLGRFIQRPFRSYAHVVLTCEGEIVPSIMIARSGSGVIVSANELVELGIVYPCVPNSIWLELVLPCDQNTAGVLVLSGDRVAIVYYLLKTQIEYTNINIHTYIHKYTHTRARARKLLR